MKKKLFKLNAYLLAILLSLALISCGGSDDGSSSDEPSIKSASQLTQNDFNVANVKGLSEDELRISTTKNDSFKNMDDSVEPSPDDDVRDLSSSSRFSVSSAGSESFEECFNGKISAAVFRPSEIGGFKAVLGNTEINGCFEIIAAMDISMIFSFAYDQVIVRDSQDATVDLEGKTVSEVFELPPDEYSLAQFKAREHMHISGDIGFASLMFSANSSSDFNAPCVISTDNRVSNCKIQFVERVSSLTAGTFNNKEVLTING